MSLKPATLDTRQSVLNAARSLFAANGYSAVSMRDIAGTVGLQQSSIYNHFSGKQSILFELLNAHMRTLHQCMERMRDDELNSDATAIDQFVAFARFHVEFHIDFPDDVFIAYMELRSLDADNRDKIVELRNSYEKALRHIIEQGKRTGDFHCVDAAVHTRAVIAMLTGVTVWYRDNGRLNKTGVVQTYVVAALQSLGVPADPFLDDLVD